MTHHCRMHAIRVIDVPTNYGKPTARRRVEYCIHWIVKRQNKAICQMACHGIAPTDGGVAQPRINCVNKRQYARRLRAIECLKKQEGQNGKIQ